MPIFTFTNNPSVISQRVISDVGVAPAATITQTIADINSTSSTFAIEVTYDLLNQPVVETVAEQPAVGTPEVLVQDADTPPIDERFGDTLGDNQNFIEFASGSGLIGAGATITITAPNGDSISFNKTNTATSNTIDERQRFGFDGEFFGPQRQLWNVTENTIDQRTPYVGSWRITISPSYIYTSSDEDPSNIDGFPSLGIFINGLFYRLPYNSLATSPEGYYIWNAHIGSFDRSSQVNDSVVAEMAPAYYPTTSAYPETNQTFSRTYVNSENPTAPLFIRDAGILVSNTVSNTFVDAYDVALGGIVVNPGIITVAANTTTEVLAYSVFEDSYNFFTDTISQTFIDGYEVRIGGTTVESGLLESINNTTTEVLDYTLTAIQDLGIVETITTSTTEVIAETVLGGIAVDSGLLESINNSTTEVISELVGVIFAPEITSLNFTITEVLDYAITTDFVNPGIVETVTTISTTEVLDYTLNPGAAVDSGLLESINNSTTEVLDYIVIPVVDGGLLESINNSTTEVLGYTIELGGIVVNPGLLESINNTTTEVLDYTTVANQDFGIVETTTTVSTTEVLGYEIANGNATVTSGELIIDAISTMFAEQDALIRDPGVVSFDTLSDTIVTGTIIDGGIVLDPQIIESTTTSGLEIIYTTVTTIIDSGLIESINNTTTFADSSTIFGGDVVDPGLIDSNSITETIVNAISITPGSFIVEIAANAFTFVLDYSVTIGGTIVSPADPVIAQANAVVEVLDYLLTGVTVDSGIIESITSSTTEVIADIGNQVHNVIVNIVATSQTFVTIIPGDVGTGYPVKALVLDDGVVRQTTQNDKLLYTTKFFNADVLDVPQSVGVRGSLHYNYTTRELWIDLGEGAMVRVKQSETVTI